MCYWKPLPRNAVANLRALRTPSPRARNIHEELDEVTAALEIACGESR